MQIRQLQQQQQVLESWGGFWTDDYADFGGSDLWERLRDKDGTRWVPLSVPSDRRHGANWPLWRTEPELNEFRQLSRIICATNPYCQALLRNLVNYTIGKGFAYKAQAKADIEAADPATGEEDPDQTTERSQSLVRATQKVIDRFLKINRWNCAAHPLESLIIAGSREREIYRRQFRDGDVFIRFFGQDNGDLIVRFVEPEQIQSGGKNNPLEGWSFGIRHQMEPFEDIETPVEYHALYQDASTGPDGATNPDATGDLIPAEELLHLKGADTDAATKRALPAVIWGVAAAFERAKKLQRNLSIGAAIRAATAEIWKHTTGTAAEISSLAGSLASFQQPESAWGGEDTFTTSAPSNRQINVERMRPGTIRRIPDSQEPVFPPEATGTEEQLAAVAGDLRQAGSAFSAPEYWTGDASNGNYSSLETATAPPVKNGETEQEYFKAAFLLCVWKAVKWAVEKGRLPKQALTDIEIQVEAPAVIHRNDLDVSQANAIKIQNGYKSPQTCAMEDGLDPDTEFANKEEYDKRFGGLGAGLQLPDEDGNLPPGVSVPPGAKPPPEKPGKEAA